MHLKTTQKYLKQKLTEVKRETTPELYVETALFFF